MLTEIVGAESTLQTRKPPNKRKRFFSAEEKVLLIRCLGLAQADGSLKPPSGVSAARIEIGMVRGGSEFSSLYDRTVAASNGDHNLANRRIWTCIRPTGQNKPNQKKTRKAVKPVQNRSRAVKESDIETSDPESDWKEGEHSSCGSSGDITADEDAQRKLQYQRPKKRKKENSRLV